eukprot:4045542-Pyramimonas_sp.AAC.3
MSESVTLPVRLSQRRNSAQGSCSKGSGKHCVILTPFVEKCSNRLRCSRTASRTRASLKYTVAQGWQATGGFRSGLGRFRRVKVRERHALTMWWTSEVTHHWRLPLDRADEGSGCTRWRRASRSWGLAVLPVWSR